MTGMVERIKQNPRETIITVVSVIGVLVGLALVIPTLLGGNELAEATDRRTLIDTETGEVFVDFKLPTGAEIPFKNPKTGTMTLVQAEKCHWNADGTAKFEPTYVLLNEHKGDPSPTMCPDCGRRVVGHNPLPPDEIWMEVLREEAAKRGGKP